MLLKACYQNKSCALEQGLGGRRKAWCTHVLDYRSFLCLYSNKWHSLYSVGRLDSLTVDENKYCMWFTLSCQRRGRARDGEMRAATLSLLLSQLSHLDDSPPLSCSLCFTPLLPPRLFSFLQSLLLSDSMVALGTELFWERYSWEGYCFIPFFIPSSFLSQIANKPHSGYDNKAPVI